MSELVLYGLILLAKQLLGTVLVHEVDQSETILLPDCDALVLAGGVGSLQGVNIIIWNEKDDDDSLHDSRPD